MTVKVTIGTQKPEAVDSEAIRQQIPYGTVEVVTVKGGLDLPDPDNGIHTAIATAAVEAFYPIEEGQFRLRPG